MNDETKKQVRVIMPFGGDDEKKKRTAALEFKIIQEMVRNYSQEHNVAISTSICQKFTGKINDPVLEEVARADVVVAVLEGNVNVTYELAFRHMLRGQMIVVVIDQAARPKYIDDWAYIQFSEKMLDKVHKQVNDTDSFPVLSFSSGELSPGIIHAIKDSQRTYEDFEKALEQVLEQEPAPSRFYKDIVLPLLNKKIVTEDYFGLGDWAQASYYPLSVVRVDWKGISDRENGKYTKDDIENDPIVFDANWAFIELYQLRAVRSQTAKKAIDWLNQHKPLDAVNLIKHLEYTSESWDLDTFLKDQERLTKNVIFVDEEASIYHMPDIKPTDRYAKIPIIMGDKHPLSNFQRKSFLPCLLARRHSGAFPDGRHSTYLLVAYIDVTDLDSMPKGIPGAPVVGNIGAQ